MEQKPSIGRIVIFKESPDAPEHFPAIIQKVWDNRCLNLCVFFHDGPQMRTSVLPDGPGYQWSWPPRT